MLILHENHRLRAGVASLQERCIYCSKALKEYSLIMSDEVRPSAYPVACALQLVTDIMVDVYIFFCPPAPYSCLFVLAADHPKPHR